MAYNSFDTRGMSGSEIRDKVRNDSTLNELYGWLFDGGGNGALIAVRAINAAYRAESIGDRQACNAAGGFYTVRGQQCFEGSDAYDYIQAINEASPAYDRSRTWLENNANNIDDNGWITEDPEDQALADLIEEIGQETYDQASGVLDQIKDQAGAVVNDPIGAIRDIAKNILTAGTGVSITDECRATGGADWIKNCVTFGVILSIPGLEIPAAILGGVFSGVTIQDMEDTLVAAGKKWEDIKNGVPSCGEGNKQECTPGQLLEDLGDWAVDKVKDVFKDVETGGITVESVLGKLGSFLPPAVAAVIYGEFKDKINTAIGVPVFLTTEELCEQQGTVEDPDNPGSCLPVTTPPEGTVDCTDFNRSGGLVAEKDQCGGCLDGFDPTEEGGCIVAPIKCQGEQVYDELTGECKDPPLGCLEGDPCKTEAGESGTYDAECGCVADPPTLCNNKATTESGCEQCEDGSLPSEYENGDCNQPKIVAQVQCPDNTPNAGQMVDKLSDCGEPTNVAGFDCNQPRPEGYSFGTVSWDRYCGQTHCSDGTVKDDAEGSNCPGYVAPEVPDDTGSTGGADCNAQNRTTNEDGSCGECKAGYTLSENTDEGCVQDPNYVGPGDDEEESSSGGGGGGGGGGGYNSPPPDLAFDIAGNPETLSRQRFGGTQQTPDTLASLFAEQPRSAELQDFPISAFLQKGRIA